jgi:hypothetical protein
MKYEQCFISFLGNIPSLQLTFYTLLQVAQNTHVRSPKALHLTRHLRASWYSQRSEIFLFWGRISL